MNYEPLHHKYRPQTFGQLAGQEAIAQTLINALNKEKIVPAYLFCGPRGTGKTSSARILAKSLNCVQYDRPTPEPCGVCEVCKSITNGYALDVIEIDAASNTGVDNIREIIEKAQYAPVRCRYKVYVIDECHMLSTAAFNALLKTLEEPSPRVIFVLATTDPQRVLPTIISRCQRFDFRRIPLLAMVQHLKEIADNEAIDINSEALSLVAQLSNGGMRDAQTLLDQLSLLSGTITPERVWDLVGAVSEQDLLALLGAIASDNPEEVISQCRKLLDRGREPLMVLQNLANFYLTLLIAKTSPQKKELVAVTDETWQKLTKEAKNWDLKVILQGQKKLKDSEVQIKNTTQPRLWLEITLLSLLPSSNAVVMVTSPSPQPSSPVSNGVEKAVNESPTVKETQIKTNSTVTPLSAKIETAKNSDNYEEIKVKVANAIEKTSVKTFFRQNCQIISIEGQTVKLGVRNQSLLKIGKMQQKDIEGGFTKVYLQPMTVFFQETSTPKNPNQEGNSNPLQPPPTEDNQPSQGNVIPFPSKPKETKKATSSPPSSASSSELASHITQKGAENIAKSFKGEIVGIETKIPKIVNRPSVEIIEDDDDDIPF